MKISRIDAYPIRIPRDLVESTGTAGSPTALRDGAERYRWSQVYPCLYPIDIESALIRITLDSGLIGWGEAQAPLAPQVVCAIVERLLVPALGGAEFDGEAATIDRLWWRMYSAMRVRGQTGGFMLDAISGIDIALWDLAGKMAGRPVWELAGGTQRCVPAYLSGLPKNDIDEARRYFDEGIAFAKLYFDGEEKILLERLSKITAIFGEGRVGVDALWRLGGAEQAALFAGRIAPHRPMFLECPLMPEDASAHGELAKASPVSLAIGESYRTRFELAPFFACKAMSYVQPDLGRSGLTESFRIAGVAAEAGVKVVPHVSIALGPQIAAAIHFAIAAECALLEFNPAVLAVANRFLTEPLVVRDGEYVAPRGPGLGVDVRL